LLITHIELAAFFRRLSRTATLGVGLRPDSTYTIHIVFCVDAATKIAKESQRNDEIFSVNFEFSRVKQGGEHLQ